MPVKWLEVLRTGLANKPVICDHRARERWNHRGKYGQEHLEVVHDASHGKHNAKNASDGGGNAIALISLVGDDGESESCRVGVAHVDGPRG